MGTNEDQNKKRKGTMNVQLQSLNLSADVRMILVGLCRISTKREIKYSLTDEKTDGDQIDSNSVLIINGKDASSLQKWQKVKSHEPEITSVLIGNEDFHDNLTTYSVPREELGAKLLDLLDRIVNSRQTKNVKSQKDNPDASGVSPNSKFYSPELEEELREQSKLEYAESQSMLELFGGAQKRALICDDSASVRRQLKEFLEKQNFAVDEAKSAYEAIARASKLDYSIIFMDVVMPEMDGYKACKKIKKIDRCYTTPVVMLTSKSSTFNKARGILAGCDAYLTKPVNAKRLKQLLLEKASPALN